MTSLDRCLRVDDHDVADALDALRIWAQAQNLLEWETNYGGLAFTADRSPEAERIFGIRWARAEEPAPRLPIRSAEPGILAVDHAWECGRCGESGDLLLRDKNGGICTACAGLGHLAFLPPGDAALTRRTKKASRLTAQVFRWNARRFRHEHQGILTEPVAIETAARECLADPHRLRRKAIVDERLRIEIADIIRAEFPGCPSVRVEAIAYYIAVRSRGRLARCDSTDLDSVRLALTDFVRHTDTCYDDMLLRGFDRNESRQKVQPRLNRILDAWRDGVTVLDA
ncbi:DUF2293 domain-containing protein [Mycobacterium sp. pV006]|uniref:DUF2293 domain-containing protein n=1 Tax=Mycobacterium sp. pV006 TaxID=3238983 RepID=UPI00351B0D44